MCLKAPFIFLRDLLMVHDLLCHIRSPASVYSLDPSYHKGLIFFFNWVLLVLSKSVMLWLNLCYIPHLWLGAQFWALVSNLTLFTALCKSFSGNIPSDTALTGNISMGSSYLMHNASFTLFPNSFLIFYHIVDFLKSIGEFSYYYFSIPSPFCFIPLFYFIMNNFNLSKKIDPCSPPFLPK